MKPTEQAINDYAQYTYLDYEVVKQWFNKYPNSLKAIHDYKPDYIILAAAIIQDLDLEHYIKNYTGRNK